MTMHRSALLAITMLLASLGPTVNTEAQAQIVGSTAPRFDTSPAKDGTVQTDPLVIVRTYTVGDTQIGVTAEGLVTELISPPGQGDHIFANAYAVCYAVDGRMVTAFETGRESAHLGPVTIKEKGLGKLPIVFTRTTLDGILEIKRTITLDQDGLTIGMGIKNRSGSKIEFLRWKEKSDVDILGEPLNSVGRTSKTAFVWLDLDLGVLITVVGNLESGEPAEEIPLHLSPVAPVGCDTDSLPTPALRVDAAAAILFTVVVPAGSEQKAAVRVRRH